MNEEKNEPKVDVTELSDEEAADAFGEDDDGERSVPKGMDEKMGERVEGLPDFASLPQGFEIRQGKRCGWMLFRAEWTETPEKGDRWCMMWTLSASEEKAALKKAAGDQTKALDELAKATIRLIDGARADRTGGSGKGAVHIFWAELGTKCRQMITSYYVKTHTLNADERADFFANCFVVTTAVGG